MHDILATWQGLLGVTVVGLITSLITGKFLKTIIVLIIQKLIKKTGDTPVEKQLLNAVEEDWNVRPEPEQPTK